MPTPIILNGNNSALGSLAGGIGNTAQLWADAYATQVIQEQYRKRKNTEVAKTAKDYNLEVSMDANGNLIAKPKEIVQEEEIWQPSVISSESGGYPKGTRIQVSNKGNVKIDKDWYDVQKIQAAATEDAQWDTVVVNDSSDPSGLPIGSSYQKNKKTGNIQILYKPLVDTNLSETELRVKAVQGDKEAQQVVGQLDAKNTAVGGQWNELTPEQKKPHLESKILTGKDPSTYYRDTTSRMDINKDYSDYLNNLGLGAADVSEIQANYKSLSSSLTTQQKQRGMMTSFVNNINKQVDRLDTIEKDLVSRIGVRALDYPRRELLTRVKGSGSEQVVNAYLTEISNEIGKLSTGSQASIRELSESAQEKWAKIHDPNLSLKELKKILDETKQMGQMRQDSVDEGITKTQNEIRNLIPSKKTSKSNDKPKSKFSIISVED